MSAEKRNTDLYWPPHSEAEFVDSVSQVRARGLVNNLNRIGQELMTIPAETEEEFLTVGSRLSDYYEMTVKVSDMSSAAAELLSGDSMTGTVNSLRDLIERMSAYVRDSRSLAVSRDEKFADVVGSVERIREQLVNYAGMSKTLKQVGVTAMVYTAGMKTGDGGFMVLARNIKGLAESIKNQSVQADRDMRSTMESVSEILNSVNVLREKKYEEIDLILRQLRDSLESLMDSHSTASAALAEISGWSQGISDRIEDVVLAAQFQDITRQKFEHIKFAIDGICKTAAFGSGIVPAHEIGRFGHFCDKGAEELLNAKVSLVNAISNIVDSLREVSASAGILAASVHEISDSKDSAGQSYLKQMGESLDAIRASLSDIFNTEAAAMEAASHAGESLKGISSLLVNIDEIGDDIDLVALNAAVKAAQVGSAGSAMGVLARSIRAVAAETMGMTVKTIDDLNSLLSEIGKLSENLGVELQQTLGEAQRIEQEIEELIGSVTHMDFQVTELVGSTDEVVRSLSNDVNLTVDRVVSHERTEETGNRIIADLQGIAREAIELIPHDAIIDLDAMRSGFENGFVTSGPAAKNVTEVDIEFFD